MEKMTQEEFDTILNDGCRCSSQDLQRMTGEQLQEIGNRIRAMGSGFRQVDVMAKQSIDDIDAWLTTMDQAPSWRSAWKSSRLYEDYVVWCRHNRKEPVSAVSWGSVMVDRGFPGTQKGGERKRKLYRKEISE